MKLKTLPALLGLVITIGGVTATWHYAGSDIPPIPLLDVLIGLSVFDYKPEDILPDEEQNEIGQNHLDLIEKILNEASYGLNATKKPIMHELLNVVGDVVYCEQQVQGGNLKHLMIDGTYAYGLLFQIEYASETEYITYTYVVSDVKLAKLEFEIVVYKTIMRKGDNKKWTAPVSYYGKAPVVSVRTSNATLRAIDSSRWHDA